MTYPLQQAMSAVQALPEADQDMIASLIMAELADEERWNNRFNAGGIDSSALGVPEAQQEAAGTIDNPLAASPPR
ncbi:MAG: hypothetical protein WCB27_02510 [Thermoguttaceae bacterium]